MSLPEMAMPKTRSGSSSPSYASDEQESKYLARSRSLHWVKLGLGLVILAAGTTVVGCQAHGLHYYNDTKGYEKWWLALWPENFDLRPTQALLGGGIVIMISTLAFLIVAAFPSPHPRTTLLNSFASAIALAGLVAAITVVAFTSQISKTSRIINGIDVSETIESWACKWSSARNMGVMDDNGDPLTAPDGFSRVCTESRAAFALMSLLICLETIMAATAICGLWFERTMKKQRGNAVTELKDGSM